MHDRDRSELTLVSRAERRFLLRLRLRSVTIGRPLLFAITGCRLAAVASRRQLLQLARVTGQVIRWKSWHRWTAVCLLACICLAVAVNASTTPG